MRQDFTFKPYKKRSLIERLGSKVQEWQATRRRNKAIKRLRGSK